MKNTTPLRLVRMDPWAGMTDHQLMVRIQTRDVDALREVMRRYGAVLHWQARRITHDLHDAEEVVQDTFERLWRMTIRFDPERGKLISLLMTMVRNRALDQLRQRARRATMPLGGLDASDRAPVLDRWAGGDLRSTSLHSPDPVEAVLTSEALHALAEAIGRLPEHLRAVVSHRLIDLSDSKAAGVLGIPLGTYKTRMRRAHRLLRAYLARALGDPLGRPA